MAHSLSKEWCRYSGLGDVFVWLAIWKVDNGDWSTGDLYTANEQTIELLLQLFNRPNEYTVEIKFCINDIDSIHII